MATQIDVCNMALAHLGVTEGIQNVSTDRTPQGIYARLFLDTVRRQILGDFSWPFATQIASLGLIGTSGSNGFYSNVAYFNSPPPTAAIPTGNNSDPLEYGMTYAYPADCIRVRRILSGIRNDSRRTRIAYRIMTVNGAKTINCDLPNAFLEYTADIQNYQLFSDAFVLAFSYMLASVIAPGLTKGDTSKANLCLQKYQMMIQMAQAQANNEEQPDIVPDADAIAGR